MSTVRDLISRVRTTNKLLSSDNIISDRAVEKELKSSAITVIRRETNLRRLWSTATIFTEIPCLEMEDVPLAECCDYTSERVISRSKHKLPKMSEGIYGYLIQWVMNVEKKRKLAEVSFNRYVNLLQINSTDKRVYYIVDKGYLYITQPNVSTVSISAYFEENVPKIILYPPCDCNTKAPPYDECLNPLDLQFKCPGYLEDNVVKMTSKYLIDTYFRLEDDKTSDNNDNEKPRG